MRSDPLDYNYNLSSFTDQLRANSPESLPWARPAAAVPADFAPHGTTIVALKFDGGVLIAGDRRSTQGNLIASRDVQKVYVTDDHSAAGIAGTAGIAIDMVKLFAVELEHYEKLEGVPLSFDGKSTRLSGLVKQNLAAAMQGLAAVPLLVGFDTGVPNATEAGRIVSFDVVGGRTEEHHYTAIGSGSLFARSALKKLYAPTIDGDRALRLAVEALYDAADDDSATGGPDISRRIYANAISITAEGADEIEQETIEAVARQVVADRTEEGGTAR